MICSIFVYLSLVVFYFLLQTFFVYGIDLFALHPFFVVFKDILWFGGVFVLILIYRSFLLSWVFRFRYVLIVLFLLFVWTYRLLYAHSQSWSDALIGWKYDRFYLLILCSASFV